MTGSVAVLSKFFRRARKFIRLLLDNARPPPPEKFFPRRADIHRSGGKLLDNTGLTSRARGGSLHVG
jgi:hypothetical protein